MFYKDSEDKQENPTAENVSQKSMEVEAVSRFPNVWALSGADDEKHRKYELGSLKKTTKKISDFIDIRRPGWNHVAGVMLNNRRAAPFK